MDRCKISFDLTNQNGVDLYFDASVVLTILQAPLVVITTQLKCNYY
jgi:hypothetical protein